MLKHVEEREREKWGRERDREKERGRERGRDSGGKRMREREKLSSEV